MKNKTIFFNAIFLVAISSLSPMEQSNQKTEIQTKAKKNILSSKGNLDELQKKYKERNYERQKIQKTEEKKAKAAYNEKMIADITANLGQ